MGYLISEALCLSILPPLILSSPNDVAPAEDFAAEIHHVGSYSFARQQDCSKQAACLAWLSPTS